MASLPPGILLGPSSRYCVIRELNRGGTAVVYEAHDTQAGRQVALKVMDLAASSTAAAAARRELQCAAALRCEHVVRLFDCFADTLPGYGQLLVIVWELVQGSDLLDLLNAHHGRLAEHHAAALFLQLVRGVSAIHRHGLAHRDLKPENCMVEAATGRLLIIDFGLSKRQQSAVTLGVGTPDYMAPELLGSGDLSLLRTRQTGVYNAAAADCWSLGVLLYLLVVGSYPFEDPLHPQNVVTTLLNVSRGTYRPLPPHVSPACADLVRRLLTRDPAQRCSLAQAAAHPFLAAAVAAEAAAAAQQAEEPGAAAHAAAAAAAAAEREWGVEEARRHADGINAAFMELDVELQAAAEGSGEAATIPAAFHSHDGCDGGEAQERLPSFCFPAVASRCLSSKDTPAIAALEPKAAPAAPPTPAAPPKRTALSLLFCGFFNF